MSDYWYYNDLDSLSWTSEDSQRNEPAPPALNPGHELDGDSAPDADPGISPSA